MFKVSGILVIVLLVVSGIGYLYYKDAEATIALLTENNATLTVAVETQQQTITSLQNNYEAALKETNRLNREFADIRRQNAVLADKLENNDLTSIAIEKPELLEKLINRGTANATRCFEILSGSPLNNKERNATSENAFNPECPWLWPGNASSSVRR
jgi:uncharacterized protein YcbK (DUF882 family)